MCVPSEVLQWLSTSRPTHNICHGGYTIGTDTFQVTSISRPLNEGGPDRLSAWPTEPVQNSRLAVELLQ